MAAKKRYTPPETYTRCPRCGGTGCPPGGAVDAMASKPFGQPPPVCGLCRGKGKIPGVPETKEGSTT